MLDPECFLVSRRRLMIHPAAVLVRPTLASSCTDSIRLGNCCMEALWKKCRGRVEQ
jgi:hypothetical protein